jgi:hypothetical protein
MDSKNIDVARSFVNGSFASEVVKVSLLQEREKDCENLNYI